MERIWSTELAAHVGRDVRMAGWLHHQRRLSQVTFLLLRDGAGIAQVVVESEDDRDRLAAIHPESVLEVHGRVVANEQAPGGIELHASTIVVLSATEAGPPFELGLRSSSSEPFRSASTSSRNPPTERFPISTCGKVIWPVSATSSALPTGSLARFTSE